MKCKNCKYYIEERNGKGKIIYNRCLEFDVTNFYPYEKEECKLIDDDYNKLKIQ